jgi:hypothetical protein
MGEYESEYSGLDNLNAMREAVNYNQSILRLVLRNMPDRSSPVMLDFGAGSGTFSDMVTDQAARPECLEPNQLLASSLTGRGYTVVADVEQLAENRYDYIYSLNVLEHVEHDVEVLSELRTKLTDEGTLLIYVPAFQMLFSTMDTLVGHFRRYNRKTLTLVLQTAGFEVVQSRYTDTLGFLASLIFKYLGSDDGSISARQVRFFDKYLMPINRLFDPVFGSFLGKNLYAVCKKSAK